MEPSGQILSDQCVLLMLNQDGRNLQYQPLQKMIYIPKLLQCVYIVHQGRLEMHSSCLHNISKIHMNNICHIMAESLHVRFYQAEDMMLVLGAS